MIPGLHIRKRTPHRGAYVHSRTGLMIIGRTSQVPHACLSQKAQAKMQGERENAAEKKSRCRASWIRGGDPRSTTRYHFRNPSRSLVATLQDVTYPSFLSPLT